MNTLTRLASTGVDTVDITDRILVAALIASLSDQKQIFTRKEFLVSDFSPTVDLSLRAIDQLIISGLVQVQGKHQVPLPIYKLKIPNNEQSLKTLISSFKDDACNHGDQLNKLIFEVLASECIEYVITEVKSKNLSIRTDLKPPERLFKLLRARTCSEVHMLLWQAIQNLNESDLRILAATDSHSEIITQIVDDAYQHHEKYQQFNRSIKSFKRRVGYRKSVISKILFTLYLDCGLEYFTNKWF